jgi:hypothetical protein
VSATSSAGTGLSDHKEWIVLLTVVTPVKSRLTKTLGLVNGKWKVTSDYGGITRVNAHELSVHDIASLSAVLSKAARDPKTCVIRGAIRLGFEEIVLRREGVRRLAYDRCDEIDGLAAFEECARRWLAADLDSFPLSPHIDPVGAIEHVIDEAIERLPPEFRVASCFWQLTSGHGIKSGGRVRLFFWLSHPVTNAEAKRWIAASIADSSVHAIVQPIYVASPIFPPGQRDFLAKRFGLRLGAGDEVVVPESSPWTRDHTANSTRGTNLITNSVDAALNMMGDPDPPEYPNGRGFFAPIHAAFKAAAQEFGSDLDREALLAQVDAKLREQIGRRGDAYLNRRIRDTRPWLAWLVRKAAEREARGATVAPPIHGLPAYHPGPIEDRDAALERQTATICRVIDDAGRRSAIRREVRARMSAAIDVDPGN